VGEATRAEVAILRISEVLECRCLGRIEERERGRGGIGHWITPKRFEESSGEGGEAEKGIG